MILMKEIYRASAPGKAILFGEHTVVYPSPWMPDTKPHIGIAGAIDKRAHVEVKENEKDFMYIETYIPEIKNGQTLNHKYKINVSKKETNNLWKDFERIYNDDSNPNRIIELKKFYQIDSFTPLKIILGKFSEDYGFQGMDITMYSEIPSGSHLGSGSSAFAALSGALLSYKEEFNKNTIADYSFFGDVSILGAPSRIDDNTVTYGELVRFTKLTPKEKKLEKIKINNKIYLAIGNTGTKSDTGTVVNEVKEMILKKPELIKELDKVNEISDEGLEHLKNNNLKGIGECMNRNYEVLKNIGVSILEIDELVDIAIKNGAYGAKPTGACKGGCVIAVSDDLQRITEAWEEKGYETFITEIGCEGVRVEKYSFLSTHLIM